MSIISFVKFNLLEQSGLWILCGSDTKSYFLEIATINVLRIGYLLRLELSSDDFFSKLSLKH